MPRGSVLAFASGILSKREARSGASVLYPFCMGNYYVLCTGRQNIAKVLHVWCLIYDG